MAEHLWALFLNHSMILPLCLVWVSVLGTCETNRIHHGWSVEIGKSQPEGPSVSVGNEARRVSHRNDGPEG